MEAMKNAIPLLVFSDLDGTLLDHDTYSWKPARPALNRLKELGVPVILATSKTAAETVVLQDQMGLAAYPAIVENGAGLIGQGAPELNQDMDDYRRLREVLAGLPNQLRRHFTGFGDMQVKDVAEVTGLSFDDVARARARSFSEPGLWSGSAQQRKEFLSALANLGVSARTGGRFLTLSFGKTKMDRMAEVEQRYAPEKTLALGDAPNDREMLEQADFGIIISNPGHSALPLIKGEGEGRIRRTEAPGPTGWNVAVNEFLDRQEILAKDMTVG